MRWYVLVLVALPLCAQQPGGAKARNPFAGDAAALEAGRKLFAETCSACHGVNGEGGLGPSLTDGREIRRASDSQLFTSVRKGVPGSDMPPFDLPEDQIWRLVSFVRSLSAPAIETVVPGDAAKGQAVFEGKGGCAKCHMIGGKGGFTGPDLSDAGARRSVGQLREAILEPSKRLTDGFTPVTVVLPDGSQIRGVARNYTNYSLQVVDGKGQLHLLERSKEMNVVVSQKSTMPGDYAKRLTANEIDDLVAYLSRQSTRPPQGGAR